MPFETLNDDRKPVLMIVVGRQRVGKTTFLNALAQYLRGHGASFEIWDADKMNATNNMSLFHREALQPTSVDPEDVKAWLEQRFTDLVERRFDAMLDVGGGDTPLARLVAEVPIVPTLEDEGVRVVVVHVVGPDLADLDYLDRFEQDDLFAPGGDADRHERRTCPVGPGSGFRFPADKRPRHDHAIAHQRGADRGDAAPRLHGSGDGSGTDVRGRDERQGRFRWAESFAPRSSARSQVVDQRASGDVSAHPCGVVAGKGRSREDGSDGGG